MPTVEIVTAALPANRKRAIAVRLTRWLVNRGVTASHVVVSFTDESRNSLFSGGMPIDAITPRPPAPAHARVVCCIGANRDDRFRDELADELVAALATADRDGFVYVEFRPIESPLVYLAHGGRLSRADQVVST
ncbi:hypothetical protein [Kutzneria sp. CA-103260]|uniref:hypothetical protein n=1 Tax=Kutzneria sp. CA-103260 TaxID=2802641 RepID=UPI001BA9D936|nr:hypothetical protein [Kutzneria sp. CA-103260]QUQ68838.1 hypothetical protein JJ691_65850 [Kutzneria sp. CA-103260]